MQDRGLAAYISELIGTLLLVFAIGTVVTLYVSSAPDSQTGSDFAVVGFVQGLALFALIMVFGSVSGGHFNPAVTVAATILKKIDPVDAVVYILAQLSGGVLGALLVKGLLSDEGRAGSYGAPSVSSTIGNNFHGFIGEFLGSFLLIMVIVAVAMNVRARQEWAPLAIGFTFVFAVMIMGPLTGASFNPARWFGPALIGDSLEAKQLVPYVLGPIAAALAAVGLFKFVLDGPQYADGPEPDKQTPGAPKDAVVGPGKKS